MKLITLAFLFSAAFAKAPPPPPANICKVLNAAVLHGTPAAKLNQFLAAHWKYLMIEYPTWATDVGFPGQDDRWPDYSIQTLEREKKEVVCSLKALNKIPFNKLSVEDRVTFDLRQKSLEREIEGQKFGGEFLVLDQLGGLHQDVADLMTSMSRASAQDYENRLKRLDKVPVVEEQIEILMREGLKRKITAVKMFLSRVPGQFDRLLTPKVEDSPIYAPFADMGPNIRAADRDSLQKRAKDVILAKVYPALQKLKSFIITDYIPGARESINYSDMPNGKEWYAYLVKYYTTTDQTPEQLHQLGLSEVARITAEMEKVKDEVKFHGDLKEFNNFLLKDKRFFYTDKNDLLTGFRDVAKRIDPELPHLFKTLPRLTYGVHEMPAYKAKEAPAAFYEPGSLEAGRAGFFVANTTDLPGRPKWGMEALTLHEAVPGHHLQIALAQEMKEMPEFRKHLFYTAYVEGWGLYAESLGSELGLYKDLYTKYGQLSYEIWRAIRLVTDTGIHAKGWTRQQALDYFAANMPKAPQEIANEVDRYITWPGQALAYKVGQLKFRELRERAKAELGENFDVREFHDQLLKHGALPLELVEKNVNQWIAVQKKKKAA